MASRPAAKKSTPTRSAAAGRPTRASVKRQFADAFDALAAAHPEALARLEQLRPHVATCQMLVDHVFDEAAR